MLRTLLADWVGLDAELENTVLWVDSARTGCCGLENSRLIEPSTIYPLANRVRKIAILGRFTDAGVYYRENVCRPESELWIHHSLWWLGDIIPAEPTQGGQADYHYSKTNFLVYVAMKIQ